MHCSVLFYIISRTLLNDTLPFRSFDGSTGTAATGVGLEPGEASEAIARNFLLWLHSLVRSPVLVSGDNV